MFEYKGLKITWLGHDGFRLSNARTVCIDPYQIKGAGRADIVCVSHEHYDHCSPEDLKKVVTAETVVVATEACRGELSGLKAKDVRFVKPGDELEVSGVGVKAVPAYNVSKFRAPGRPFHPKEEGKVGYIITMGDVKVYHTGDTDPIPEMEGLQVDVALLPVSGTYVMTAEEAAEAASRIKPKVAIPMHYGSFIGSRKDAERFKALAPCEVQILEKGA